MTRLALCIGLVIVSILAYENVCGHSMERKKWVSLDLEPTVPPKYDVSTVPGWDAFPDMPPDIPLSAKGKTINGGYTSTKRRMKRKASSSQSTNIEFSAKPELRHEYGMLFNHHGYLIPGLQRLQLFLTIPLPQLLDITHEPPQFPSCEEWNIHKHDHVVSADDMGEVLLKHTAYVELNKEYPFLDEAVHYDTCVRIRDKYHNMLTAIQELKRNVTYKLTTIIPKLLPNEEAVRHYQETIFHQQQETDKPVRNKRALGLIFAGVSAIGGLIMKGINAYSSYKKSKAMSRAMEQLYTMQRLDHDRLTRLEDHTAYMANTIKNTFHFMGHRLNHLDKKLIGVIQKVKRFMNETDTHFKYTWQVMVSNRLAIKLLTGAATLYDQVLYQYKRYYERYDVTLDHFIAGLDALATGRLTVQVLDPVELDRFLGAIRQQLAAERSPFRLAFNHTYQFYAEPLVTFSNTHDTLLINLPVLLKPRADNPLMLYSIEAVPIPFDTNTIDGKAREYTLLNNSYPYMAINQNNYIPLNEMQLRRCTKIGATYYCENSFVIRHRSSHTCESAIFYREASAIITGVCKAKFVSQANFPPHVLDAGEHLLLFNLPRPWILICGRTRRPLHLPYSSFKVVKRTEFCECALSAGEFFLDNTMVTCPSKNSKLYDGKFTSYYVVNKYVFDYLQANLSYVIDPRTRRMLSELLTHKPKYQWASIAWYEDDDPAEDTLSKQQETVMLDMSTAMTYVTKDINETKFRSEVQYLRASEKFHYFMKYAKIWRIVEFISALLAILCCVVLLGMCIFRGRIIESAIMSSAVLEEFKFVTPQQLGKIGVEAAPITFPPLPTFLPFTFGPVTQTPPSWTDNDVMTDKTAMRLSMVLTLGLVTVALAAILFVIYRKCKYVSSVPRICFPVYPISKILRGSARTDIFIEVIDVSMTAAMWAYLATTSVFPSSLRLTGRPAASDLAVVRLLCVKQLQIKWGNITLHDDKNNIIHLPDTANVSVWTNDLAQIERHKPYQIKVFGRVLDTYTEIPQSELGLGLPTHTVTSSAPPQYCY